MNDRHRNKPNSKKALKAQIQYLLRLVSELRRQNEHLIDRAHTWESKWLDSDRRRKKAESREIFLMEKYEAEEKNDIAMVRWEVRQRRFPWLFGFDSTPEFVDTGTTVTRKYWEKLPRHLMKNITSFLKDDQLWKCRGISAMFYDSFYSQDLLSEKLWYVEGQDCFNFHRALALAAMDRRFTKLSKMVVNFQCRRYLTHFNVDNFPRVLEVYYDIEPPAIFQPHPHVRTLILNNAYPDLISAILMAYSSLERLHCEFRDIYDCLKEIDFNCFTWHFDIEQIKLELWPSPLHRNFDAFCSNRFPNLSKLKIMVNDLESNPGFEGELMKVFKNNEHTFDVQIDGL